MNNICLMSDSYKMGHHGFYPDGTQKVYSYFESRNGEIDDMDTQFVERIVKAYKDIICQIKKK